MLTKTYQFELGDAAPMNQKALNSTVDLCTDCGKKLGANPFYFEVNTSWEIIKPNSNDQDSQGCFPIGSSCASKFAPELLVRMGA